MSGASQPLRDSPGTLRSPRPTKNRPVSNRTTPPVCSQCPSALPVPLTRPKRLPSTEELSDQTLLGQCADGDERAWTLLVARYENLVYSEALKVGLNEEDAGDVFQQVWLELHRSLPRIRNATGLPRWLIVATRRLSYKVAARARRLVPSITREMVDPGSLPDQELQDVESRLRLEQALDQLGGSCAELLRMLFLQSSKQSYEEISDRTGLAVGSIGPTRARCLARLKKILEAIS